MNYLVAVVTGASQGVGAAIAARLAQMDFHVCLLARDRVALEDVKDRIVATGGSAFVYACDVAAPEQVERVAAEVLRVHGRCDVLVNNAAIGMTNAPVQELSVADWDAMMDTNLRGPFLMLRAFAPAMIARGGGHIINIGSLAGKNPLPKGAAYAASKWGLLGLMLSAAEELRQHGVRVSVVSPGSIATDFGGKRAFGYQSTDDSWKIAPEDIAEVVAQIAAQSDRSFVSEILVRPLRKPPR
jgi:3-oxoacyl-[acyl-carrier protein] reductase